MAALLTWLVKLPAVPAFSVAGITAAAAALAGFGKDRIKQLLAESAADRGNRRQSTIGPGGRRVRVADVDPILLGLHQPARTDSGGDVQAYVRRDVHDQVVALIRRGGFVLVQGDSAVGKTRLAFEAAREAVPDWFMVRPSTVDNLKQLAGARLSRTVVWLEDLESYLTPDGLTPGLLDRLCPMGRQVAVVATLRLQAREALGAAEDDGTERQRSAAVKDVLALGDRCGLAPVLRGLSPAERARAEEAGMGDERVADALRSSGTFGFGPWLAGGPEALKRWTAGKAGRHSVGAALIEAAIDCRRAGYLEPLPRQRLTALHRGYLPEGYLHRADAPSVEAELTWAASSERGTEACLTLLADGRVAVFDYLVDHVQRHPSENGAIRDEVWDTVLGLASPEQASSVGFAAIDHGRPDRAEAAFAVGAAGGQVASMDGLGRVLSDQPGRREEAERWYRKAIAVGDASAGDTVAMVDLGWLLAGQPGGEKEAEDWYRKAIAAGRPLTDVLRCLGDLLAGQRGRQAEAEMYYRTAIERGDTRAPYGLWKLLATQPSRQGEAGEWYLKAENAYRKAAAAGQTVAMVNLGWLLAGQPGGEKEAEDWYRKAIAAGRPFTDVLRTLGDLLAGQPGRQAEAEAYYRKAIEGGDSRAQYCLGELLATQPGRQEEAKNWQRIAADGAPAS